MKQINRTDLIKYLETQTNININYKLRDKQLLAIIDFIKGNDILCVLPTGYGKTIIGIICALYLYNKFKLKTIYIGMMKSLNNEMYETFRKYTNKLNMSIFICDGDHDINFNTINNQNWLFGCFTPEKFNLILINEKKRNLIMKNVGLLIIDESHLIGDEERGSIIENIIVLSKIMFNNLRYIYLSATLLNKEEYSQWLNSKLITSDNRPIPLIKKYIIINNKNKKQSFNEKIKELVKILNSVEHLNDNFLIFTTSRARSEDIIKELTNKKNIYECINMGYAYHHAGLSKEIRELIETKYRNKEIKILACTPTLSVGINLPANVVILFDIEQYDGLKGNRLIDANRLQQTIGRSGRPTEFCLKCNSILINNKCKNCGWENIGYVYFFVPSNYYNEIKYMSEVPAKAESKMKNNLDLHILQWISCNIVKDFKTLRTIIKSLFLKEEISDTELYKILFYLQILDLIVINDNEEYKITKKGELLVKLWIKPTTYHKWLISSKLINNINDFTELYIRFGDIDELINNVVIRSEDKPIFKLDLIGNYKDNIINECLFCAKLKYCINAINLNDYCNEFISIKIIISNNVIKSYFFTFYDYLSKKLNFNQNLYISESDKLVIKKASEKIFKFASIILYNNRKLSNSLNKLSILCSYGILDNKLVELLEINGIGIKYALKLYENNVKSKEDLLKLNDILLSEILNISLKQAKNLMENINYGFRNHQK